MIQIQLHDEESDSSTVVTIFLANLNENRVKQKHYFHDSNSRWRAYYYQWGSSS